MTSVFSRRFALISLLAAALLVPTACSGLSEEGEACDRDNGNADCENGLICRGEWEVRANESVCCPKPPAEPSDSACEPQIEHAHPDPSIDASYGAGGGGGSSGSGGSSGTGGLLSDSSAEASGDASDAAADSASDASAESAAADGG